MENEQKVYDQRFGTWLMEQLGPVGLDRAQVSFAYAHDMQDYHIVIGGDALTDDQLEAVHQVHRTGPWITFDSEDNRRRFQVISDREARKVALAQACAYRAQHPDLPAFDPETMTLAAFARRLETYCGFEPGTALVVIRDRALSFTPVASLAGSEKWGALMSAALAASVEAAVDLLVTGEEQF